MPNAVVVGTRIDVDAAEWTPAAIRSGSPLAQAAGQSVDPWGDHPPGDWRDRFLRGNKRLVIDDTAFRACVSNNFSMSRAAFNEVGAFSDVFTSWGGEDTEIGWRLFQDGNFVIPDGSAVVYHQVQGEDPVERESVRATARTLNRSRMADLIPSRAYRTHPASTFSVPYVTWLVWGSDEEEIASSVKWADSVGLLDNEVVVVGPASAVRPWVSRAASSDRFSVVTHDGPPRLDGVLGEIRGELVVCVGDMESADRSLVVKVLNRFIGDPRLGIMQAPYVDGDGSVARRVDDLLSYDECVGFPAFTVVRRRAIAKSDRSVTVAEAVAAVAGVEHGGLVTSPKVRVSSSLGSPSRTAGLPTLAKLGLGEIARTAKARVSSQESADATSKPTGERSGISYIGFTGRGNLGDEAILTAVAGLLPGIAVERDLALPSALMVGGGTIINSKRYYLTRLLREDRPGIERFMFAPGVRDPEFWGVTEPMDDWFEFLRSVERVTVRGPDSAKHLATLGWKGDVEVIGDPALSLTRPANTSRGDEVLVAPLHTGGNLFGSSDDEVLQALAAEVRRMSGLGLQVTLMASFAHDDRWILELERMADVPNLGYLAGYADLNVTLERIANARLVVGERLHASILAAAMGTPFLALAYRPKALDFAKSINATDLVVRTDGLDVLAQGLDRVLDQGDEVMAYIEPSIERLRSAQRQHADHIRSVLGT